MGNDSYWVPFNAVCYNYKKDTEHYESIVWLSILSFKLNEIEKYETFGSFEFQTVWFELQITTVF